MKKNIRTILIAAFGVFFLLCAARVVIVKLPYWKGRHVYNSTSQQYTEQSGSAEDGTDADSAENNAAANRFTEKTAAGEGGPVLAPIKVDFKALKSVNDDVVGWIYCEGTQINYPVLQGETNDTYIRTLYTGEGHPSGSIFVDAGNCRSSRTTTPSSTATIWRTGPCSVRWRTGANRSTLTRTPACGC